MTRELTTDLAVLERLTAPAGKDVVDVGCGGGALVRDLQSLGARVTGIEISESQLAAAIARDDGGGARYLVGRAQELPRDDASTDLVVFMRTLHHIPPEDLDTALGEARRVLAPHGVIYVAEPLPEGDFFALTSMVEDELEVRAAAQSALADAATVALERDRTVEYEVRASIAGLDALRTRIVSVDPGRADIFDARRDEIAEAFAALGEPGTQASERWFTQPMRADVLRRSDAATGSGDAQAARRSPAR